jgi:uncharacterized protein
MIVGRKQHFHYSFVNLFMSSDLTNRRIGLMTVKSPNPGPAVWLTACIHGDEVGGIVIIQEVFKWLKKNTLKQGSVFAFPLLNPTGFESVSRFINFSKEDLNRCFPGNPKGTMGERTADRILTKILETQPALVIDLHNDWIHSIPYLILDHQTHGQSANTIATTLFLAKQTGFILIKDESSLETTRKTLSGAIIERNIPAMTIEVGGSYLIHEKNIRSGLTAILNILSALKMITHTPCPLENSSIADQLTNKVLSYYDRPRCTTSGVIRFLVKPGQRIKKQERIAAVYNVFGRKLETIRAETDGIVLGHTDYAVSLPGMELIAFGKIED